MRNLILVILVSQAHATCLSPREIVAMSKAGEVENSPKAPARAVTTEVTRINEALAFFDPRIKDAHAEVADALGEASLTLKQFQALREIKSQAKSPEILKSLTKAESDRLAEIDIDYLANFGPEDVRAVETKLRGRALDEVRAVREGDVNARAKDIARAVQRNFGRFEATDVLSGLDKHFDDKNLMIKVRECLKTPSCVTPVVRTEERKTWWGNAIYNNPLQFTSENHVREGHVAPASLVKLFGDLKDASRGAQARRAVDELAKVVTTSKKFDELSTAERETLKQRGLDREAWDFLFKRRGKDQTTFYRDENHRLTARSEIEKRCAAGECVPASRPQQDGSINLALEHQNVRYQVNLCLDAKKGCGQENLVRSYFPECGPGVYRLETRRFTELIKQAAAGDQTAYAKAADAYQFVPCT